MPNKYYQEGVLAGMLAGGVQANVTNIGYQVTFKVDGNDYYVASCQQGESITAPPTPTKAGYNFIRWVDNNGNAISFPYTPNVDTECSAVFENYFLVSDNEVMCVLDGYVYTCVGGNGDIMGWGNVGGWACPILLTTTPRPIYYTRTKNGETRNVTNIYTQVTYNGVTYYSANEEGLQGNYSDTSGLNRFHYTTPSAAGQAGIQEAALEILRAYFGDTD